MFISKCRGTAEIAGEPGWVKYRDARRPVHVAEQYASGDKGAESENHQTGRDDGGIVINGVGFGQIKDVDGHKFAKDCEECQENVEQGGEGERDHIENF